MKTKSIQEQIYNKHSINRDNKNSSAIKSPALFIIFKGGYAVIFSDNLFPFATKLKANSH